MAGGGSDEALWEAELRSLREELKVLRTEQLELARAVDEMVRTFRAIATHLGIASEPYRGGERPSRDRDLPGFA